MWRERKMIKNRHGGRCISFAVTLNGVSRLVTFPESSDGPRLERVYWMVAFRYEKEEILIFTTSILSIPIRKIYVFDFGKKIAWEAMKQ